MENSMENKKCPVCGSTETKQGKLMGIAAVQSLAARAALGGSELILTFCAQCGEVLRMQVAKPDAIHGRN